MARSYPLRGDFNLIRNQKEKSNSNINFSHSMAFNDWINKWDLIEYSDPHRVFTWSNNQTNPIMAKLDRMLASVDWDLKYLVARLTVLPRGLSDHNPIQVQFGEKPQVKETIFRFEKWWLDMEDFVEVVQKA
jgi:hypothetical protein